MSRTPTLATVVLIVLTAAAAGSGQIVPQQPAELPPAPDAPDPDQLPGITIDPEGRYVDLEAEVVLREGDWLELLICSPNTREHESIFTSPARPSHIHLALLMIGLKDGEPMTWRREGDEFITTPPHGPELEIFMVIDEQGEQREIPANELIFNQHEGEVMQGNTWLFTGSAIQPFRGEELYMADLNGTIISIVNFGDDLLARPTELTNLTDEQQWNTNTERIPELGTELTIRLRPVSNDETDEGKG